LNALQQLFHFAQAVNTSFECLCSGFWSHSFQT
jgi:hypothetical protein